MLSYPTGTAMLSNVHLTCCLDGTNMVSISLSMSRIQQEISKQTKAAPSCPLGLLAASQFCLLSELTTSEPSFIGVSGLYLYIFGETNPQPSCTVRGNKGIIGRIGAAAARSHKTHNKIRDTSLRTMSNFSVIKAKILQIPSFLTEQSK